jgi:hypothetical protein
MPRARNVQPHQLASTPSNATTPDDLADVMTETLEHDGIPGLIAWHNVQLQKHADEVRADAFRTIIAAMWTSRNPRLQLVSLAYCAGLECTQGKSMTEVANWIGCSRATISKWANVWSDRVNLRSPAMKSDNSRDSYARTRGVSHRQRLPDTLERISFDFARWQIHQGNDQLTQARPHWLGIVNQALKPIVMFAQQVEARLSLTPRTRPYTKAINS